MTTRRQRSRQQALEPRHKPAYRPAQPLWPITTVTEDTPRLHYRGDRTDFNAKQVYGPDAYGAIYRAGKAEYDAAANRTTIYFRPIAPPKRVLA